MRKSHPITAERCRIIDATRWVRLEILGYRWMGLAGWRSDAVAGGMPLDLHCQTYTRRDGPAVRLNYRLKGATELLEYDIRLQITDSARGGVRWWFLCPILRNGHSCGRRVQKFYLPPNARQVVPDVPEAPARHRS